MAEIIKTRATDGTSIEFTSQMIGQGGMKDVFFSPDKSYVVGFFRQPQDQNSRDRLNMITGKYRQNIFAQAGGSYWESVFCWPTHTVEFEGRLGVVAPTYPAHFFFAHGSVNNDMLGIQGREKEGKWFASASNQNKFLDIRERGNWRNYLAINIKIARAVRRMHAAGLAHSDLSYKNVLVDPAGGNACIIDIDGLVVPGKFPPDVVGTPDFIAPEVMASLQRAKGDPERVLPSIATDRHALAVLIYMYLLFRHPLRGSQVHDVDPQRDEVLAMGKKALFIEHPTDDSNRVLPYHIRPSELPWKNTGKIPYSVGGPYLKELFDRAFIAGLHDPSRRPGANEWERALVKTNDLVQPCVNPRCIQKWYVFDNTRQPRCPFCGTPFRGKLPVLNLYSSRGGTRFMPDDHRLMVYNEQYLYPWHVNRNVFPNEKLTPEQRAPVGYFVRHEGKWVLVNQRMPDLTAIESGTQRPIPIGSMVELQDGQQLLLSRADGGRLVAVQMVES
ncbi:MAG: lipopolysaccharide kinase InaA family protein [Bacteroidota bacterium]